MKYLYLVFALAPMCWTAEALPAEPVARCKLDLVARPPLPDDWEEAKKIIIFGCVDSQTFLRSKIKGVVSAYEGDFSKVVKKQPAKYVSASPLRGVATLASRQFAFVLDHKRKESADYDRLYLDLNGNGDLTDDKPIDALPVKGAAASSDRRAFPRTTLTVDFAGTKADYPLSFVRRYTHVPDFEHVTLYLAVEAYRRGEIVLDGKRHAVAVLDWNSNGRFDDVLSPPEAPLGPDDTVNVERGDVLLIDPEKLAAHDLSWLCPLGEHRQFLGKLNVFEGKYYRVKVSPSGDEMTWTPVAVSCGSVNSPHAPCRVGLISEMGYFDLTLERSKPVQIPAGQWRLVSYTITVDNWQEPGSKATSPLPMRDVPVGFGPKQPTVPEKPDVSRISANGTGANKPILVEAGKTTTFGFGPPYKPLVRLVRDDEKTRLLLLLQGADGEQVEDVVVNGRQPERPTLTITDSNGKVVAQADLEYG
jgi:hypothetical protein